MKYMGSKSRIKKDVISVISENVSNYSVYLEPFVGGANVIDDVNHPNKVGYDYNKYLISLLNYVKFGGQLPNSVSREFYNDVRSNQYNDKYPTWLVGAVGFLASYNGRWFDGGYAKPSKTRDYYDESKRNLVKQSVKFADIEFEVKDFFELELSDSYIYCDPPYNGTKQYGINKHFDSDKFWEKVRKLSKNNFVLVSEENAPNDFECIWEKKTLRSIKSVDKSYSTEKLFVHKSLVSEIDFN